MSKSRKHTNNISIYCIYNIRVESVRIIYLCIRISLATTPLLVFIDQRTVAMKLVGHKKYDMPRSVAETVILSFVSK